MTAYVFLGPSLPVEQARVMLDATYLPPVQQGDVLRLLELKPRFIGIIDGYFETVPAVWHKEILFAMHQGVHVFGAASMGALRAAELHSFGMIGVGKIFEWFSNGTIEADEEVAVRHGPPELGYLALNQALVDLRDSSAEAVKEGVIGPLLAEKIIATAKALPFWDRCCETIAGKLRSPEVTGCEIDAWLDYMGSRYVSLKSRDAATLLDRMKEFIAQPWQPKVVSFAFEQTIFLERLLNEIALAKSRSSLDSPREQSADREAHVMDRLRGASLLRVLARKEADHFGWDLDPAEIAERANALWSAMGITDPGAASRWMERNGITERMLQSYISDELFIARLDNAHRVAVERQLALMLLISHQARPKGSSTPSGNAPPA